LYREEEDKALKYYQKVVELDPADEHNYRDEAQYQIASIRMRINDDPQSLHEFIEKSSNVGYLMRAYSSLARYYRKHKNVEKLVATHEDCIARFPESTSMMNAFAWDIFRMKASEYYNRGIEVAKKAVELEPDAAAIWDTLGQLQFEAGNVAEAIEAMQKAADLDPDMESFKENLERYKKSQMKA
jgi:tetratricopeptide (TPR) repeat protein